MNEYANELLNSAGTLLFGRVTYELMAGFWPTSAANVEDHRVAYKMNHLPKFVFSKTLSTADWNNTRLVKEDVAGDIFKLKQSGSGQEKDIVIFGNSDFACSLIQHHLIDEYQIIVNPVVLGNGKRLFEGLNDKLDLKLRRTKTFSSGNVLLYYEQVNNN